MLLARKYSTADSIKIPFRCTPGWMSLKVLIMVLTRTCLLLQVITMATFLDRSLLVLTDGMAISMIALPALMLCIIVAWSQISDSFQIALNCKVESSLRKNLRIAITEKRASLTFKDIEDHKTWDLITRVSKSPETSVMEGVAAIEGIVGIIIQSLGMMLIIWLNVWWAAIAIVVISIPTLVVAIKSGQAHYEAERKVTELDRRHDYLSELMLNRDTLNERELFQTVRSLASKWVSIYEQARKHRLQVETRWMIKSKISGLSIILLTVAVTLVLIPPLSFGTITLGLFIASIQAISSMVSVMTWEFNGYIEKYTKSVEYFRDVTEFCSLPEIQGALTVPQEPSFSFESLEFRGVSFCYPGTDTKILDDISFTMEAGKHYAIVGVNGAGKTTLIKLILGFYSDFEGQILINGKDIREYAYSEIKGCVSALFQDFGQYAMSFKNNIAIGDIAHIKDEDNRISDVIKALDLNDMVQNMPDGIDTILGRVHDNGHDLSGGQWQRLAMARMMFSNAALRILDEPTSALDPIMESELYEQFSKVSQNSMIIFISHRLGSTMLADEILVIDQGKVSERGSHKQLMAANGLYTQMYESQRSWYQ